VTQIAKANTKLGAAAEAREAWEKVQRAASSSGDAVTAQVASVNSAFTWVMEGQASKAVEQLKKIAISLAASTETDALRWFVLGQAHVKAHDLRNAHDAFAKAITLVPSDHPVARQALAALAELD
jgi:hypothetical protein